MNSPTARPNDDPDLARWGLLAVALVIGAFLMVYYVQLLRDSVVRGAQWRYSQATWTGGAPTATPDGKRAIAVDNAMRGALSSAKSPR